MPLIKFTIDTVVNHKTGSPKLYKAGELVYVALDQMFECRDAGATVEHPVQAHRRPPIAKGENPFGTVVSGSQGMLSRTSQSDPNIQRPGGVVHVPDDL